MSCLVKSESDWTGDWMYSVFRPNIPSWLISAVTRVGLTATQNSRTRRLSFGNYQRSSLFQRVVYNIDLLASNLARGVSSLVFIAVPSTSFSPSPLSP